MIQAREQNRHSVIIDLSQTVLTELEINLPTAYRNEIDYASFNCYLSQTVQIELEINLLTEIK